jgi:hypothetical protein
VCRHCTAVSAAFLSDKSNSKWELQQLANSNWQLALVFLAFAPWFSFGGDLCRALFFTTEDTEQHRACAGDAVNITSDSVATTNVNSRLREPLGVGYKRLAIFGSTELSLC